MTAVPVALLALSLTLVGVPAWGSEGSIPGEVATYASDPAGLIARLADLTGVDAQGNGLTFDETAKAGQLNRVFTFTADFVAGESTKTPIERTNEWTTPITIGDKLVGLATIWINPATIKPELAEFTQNLVIAKPLADIPADAYLIHDLHRHAWLTLQGEDLTAIVVGNSGLKSATTIAKYQTRVIKDAEQTASQPGSDSGPLILVGLAGAAALALILLRLIPGAPFRKREVRDAPASATAPEAVPATTVSPKPKGAALAKDTPRKGRPASAAAPVVATPSDGRPAAKKPASAAAKATVAGKAKSPGTAKSAGNAKSPAKPNSQSKPKPIAPSKPKPTAQSTPKPPIPRKPKPAAEPE
jgi:hypothetical protein